MDYFTALLQEWRPSWNNAVEIVMVLQITGYDVYTAMTYADHNMLGLSQAEMYSGLSDTEVAALKQENEDLKAKVAALESDNGTLAHDLTAAKTSDECTLPRPEPFNFTPMGGQSNFVWLPARTMHPHGACVW